MKTAAESMSVKSAVEARVQSWAAESASEAAVETGPAKSAATHRAAMDAAK